MSADAFIKSTPQIDLLVNRATNFEEIRESVKSELERSGVVARDPHDPYAGRLLRQVEMEAPAPVAGEPANRGPEMCFRVVYPGGNDRVELTAHSDAELDAKEARIRAAYGQR
jgi:hypothetical protein